MANSVIPPPDPTLDLVLTREVDVAPALVWAAWTKPEHIKKWFTPAPWKTVECEIDLRPGGIFRTVMQSPEGEQFPGDGCYLEVVTHERLVWTNAVLPGYRPAAPAKDAHGLIMTAVISLEPTATGTKYTAHVMHASAEARVQHEAMGFHHGWNAALDQLVTLAKSW
jgi:uncharacterized protein YndB with AHSA1/START domain